MGAENPQGFQILLPPMPSPAEALFCGLGCATERKSIAGSMAARLSGSEFNEGFGGNRWKNCSGTNS